MIIAQISDSHISADYPARAAHLSACVAHINALPEPPDVVVHTGDIVHDGTTAQYAIAVDILAQLKAPLFVIPGNKDDRALLLRAFAPLNCPVVPRLAAAPAPNDRHGDQPSDFVQYAVDDFSLRMIFLDTLHTGSNKGQFCRQRLAHLQDMLAAGRNQPQVIFMHHPPFEVTAFSDSFQFTDWSDVTHLERLLTEQSPNLVKVICGHVHRETTGQICGYDVSTMASVAVDLRYGDYPEEARDAPLYHLHRFDPARGISSTSHAALVL